MSEIQRRTFIAGSTTAAVGALLPVGVRATDGPADELEVRWTVDTDTVDVARFDDVLLVADNASVVAYDWNGDAQWSGAASATITGVATVGDRVFVGTGDGVECFSSDGDSRWRLSTGNSISHITGGMDSVYAVEDGEPNVMYRILQDGHRDWETELEADVVDTTYHENGCAYVARGYGGVHLNGDVYVGKVRASGTEDVFRHYTGRDRIGAKIASTDNGLFVSVGYDSGWSTYELDNIRFENGNEVWKRTESIAGEVAFRGYNMVIPEPLVIGDAVFCAGRDQRLTKYDMISGDKEWEGDRDPHGLAERDRNLLGIVTDDTTYLRSFDTDQLVNWSFEVSPVSSDQYASNQFGGPILSPSGTKLAVYHIGGSVLVLGPAESSTGSETPEESSTDSETPADDPPIDGDGGVTDGADGEQPNDGDGDSKTDTDSETAASDALDGGSELGLLGINDRGIFVPGDNVYSGELDSMKLSITGLVLSVVGLAYNLYRRDDR